MGRDGGRPLAIMTLAPLTHLFLAAFQAAEPERGFWAQLVADIYGAAAPYYEVMIVLLLLWLLARRTSTRQGDFSRQAQEVLEEKFRRGEISQRAYEKFRQDIAVRPKR